MKHIELFKYTGSSKSPISEILYTIQGDLKTLTLMVSAQDWLELRDLFNQYQIPYTLSSEGIGFNISCKKNDEKIFVTLFNTLKDRELIAPEFADEVYQQQSFIPLLLSLKATSDDLLFDPRTPKGLGRTAIDLRIKAFLFSNHAEIHRDSHLSDEERALHCLKKYP